MNNLTCYYQPRLDGIPPAELERLFPAPSITAPLLALLQESGIDGFTQQSIVVFRNDAPILLLPLFETRFDLSQFVGGWIKQLLKVAGRLLPSFFQPRILGVGLLIGKGSEIGMDPQIDAGTLQAAWKMAVETLQRLAAERKSDLLAFYNFDQEGNLPGEIFNQFHRVRCQSYARLPIDFNSLEEFLACLSRAARKDLRRKMRASHQVRLIRSRDISFFQDRIYSLYLQTVARGALAFGRHNRLFFEKFCEKIPEAEYRLYFVKEELAAFNLLVVKQQELVDIYFCMEYELGRRYNLYVLSWIENIRTCLERKIPLYQAGQGAEKTKAHLGATFIPSFIFFKHRQPVFDRLIARQPALIQNILVHLGFWPAVPPGATSYSVQGSTGKRFES